MRKSPPLSMDRGGELAYTEMKMRMVFSWMVSYNDCGRDAYERSGRKRKGKDHGTDRGDPHCRTGRSWN